MKKILFLVVFMVFASAAVKAANNCDGTTNCRGCAGGSAETVCCDALKLNKSPMSATVWNNRGCNTTNAPINKGLILLLITGMGLGAFVVYKNKASKLV